MTEHTDAIDKGTRVRVGQDFALSLHGKLLENIPAHAGSFALFAIETDEGELTHWCRYRIARAEP